MARSRSAPVARPLLRALQLGVAGGVAALLVEGFLGVAAVRAFSPLSEGVALVLQVVVASLSVALAGALTGRVSDAEARPVVIGILSVSRGFPLATVLFAEGATAALSDLPTWCAVTGASALAAWFAHRAGAARRMRRG